MDKSRFDILTTRIATYQDRRWMVRGALGALAAALGLGQDSEGEAKRGRRDRAKVKDKDKNEDKDVDAQGPCGNGKRKANRCKRNRQCCTGYCHKKKRCRCRRPGQFCSEDRNCCPDQFGMFCINGTCQPGCPAERQCGGSCCPAGQTCNSGTCQDLCPSARMCGSNCCATGEVCDNGTCRPPRCNEGGPCTVFATSSLHNGNLGGLTGADAICQQRASDAGLTGQYKAWLSDAAQSPATRFTHATTPYLLPDGALVAKSWTDLITDLPRTEIGRTESGTRITFEREAWTNTEPNGSASGGASLSCNNWTSGASANSGRVGDTDDVDDDWTSSHVDTCGFTWRLYCFEQP